MIFSVSLLTAVLFVLIFEKAIKKKPAIFYLLSVSVSLADIILTQQGISFDGFFGSYIRPMFHNGTLAAAFFVLVMYANTFENGSDAIKLLMPLRGELSIMASVLAAGHIVAYGQVYFCRLFTQPESMQPVILAATILSLLLLLILIPLFLTSFQKIRRRMKPKSWKKLQRSAYLFYALVYLHVILFQYRSALRGESRSILNAAVYSAVFLWYLVCRILKALHLKGKIFRLNRARVISLVLILFLSIAGYEFMMSRRAEDLSMAEAVEAKKQTEKRAEEHTEDPAEGQAEERMEDRTKEPAREVLADGTYRASAFGYAGDITVEIVVQDAKVIDVHFASYEDEEEYKHFSDEIIRKISAEPLGDIDAVSGATFSTEAVIQAYHEALRKAGYE